ncbi:MAG: response regulator transcription factor [Elusimicrobiota bacterium]|nr:MAG: response regulator transcription factor [Elusimicrobiota bacterium]
MIVAVGADNAKLRGQVVSLLESGGHRAVEFSDPARGGAFLRAEKPHMLVVAFGDGDDAAGFVKRLRGEEEFRLLPVLCVDPKADSRGTVAMLDAGADDAIARPFQPAIFLARVRTLLRRAVLNGGTPEETATVLSGGPVTLKLIARQATIGGKPLDLTRLEFDLLSHLLKHPDRAFKRDELLAAVWNYPGSVETRTLDKHVESLRRKLGASSDMIQTVHGLGYRFNPATAKA